MTSLVTLIAFFVLAVPLDFSVSTPINYINQDKRNLIQRYVELLEDKNIKSFFGDRGWDANSFLIRNKRQIEQLDENVDTTMSGTPEDNDSQPGFFDRAAKFVMELLQRFLKWINASDN